MNCGGTVFEPLNWLTIWHSVSTRSPISMAKASSAGSISTETSPMRISPANGCDAAVAALGGVAEAEHEALVAAGQRLQADVAVGGEGQRFAGQVAGFAVRGGVGFQQAFVAEDVGNARHRSPGRRRPAGLAPLAIVPSSSSEKSSRRWV